ncbi:MAG: twin-arginine translocation signal domain-containing protein [bacterium]|nr:twin-arginine translocation signal domain-containing protein [bacterium]
MAENTEESGASKTTRRDFLKKAAIIGVGALAIGSGINVLEKKAINEGIDTDSGTFFPLYEHHEVGIKPEKIPSDLDVLFREVVFPSMQQLLETNPKDMLMSRVNNNYSKSFTASRNTSRTFPDNILEKVASSRITIMLGDLDVKDDGSIEVGMGVGGILIAVNLLRDQFAGKSSKKSSSHMTRRKFLKVAGILGSAWALAPTAYLLSRGGVVTEGLGWNMERDNAVDRIIDRLYGLVSDSHPANATVFFRNLIMADKMLTVAEDIQKNTGKKTKMGFQVEYAHSGIEDFLSAGHDFCRMLLLSYPKPVLRDAVESNNGPEDFSSSRLLKLPRNFSVKDPKWEQVGDRKVVDTELKQMLEEKLA